MTPSMPLRPCPVPIRHLLCAVLASLGAAAARADDAAPGEARQAAALQVMADLTLIDGTCHGEAVNFGIAFGFVAQQGLSESAILPGGAQRAAFERALRSRRASFGPDELCGVIADNYAEALPGSVTVPTGTTRTR